MPFLAKKFGETGPHDPSVARIQQWISDLSDDIYRVREAATAALAAHLEAAAPELETAAHSTASPEVRARVTRLLALREGRHPEQERTERAVRVLEYTDRLEAKIVLERLAREGPASVAGPAKAALKRLTAREP